jgi:hypothetical protein
LALARVLSRRSPRAFGIFVAAPKPLDERERLHKNFLRARIDNRAVLSVSLKARLTGALVLARALVCAGGRDPRP